MSPKCMTILLCFSSYSHAQLPLSIEELLVDEKALKLDSSFSYTRSEQLVQGLEWIPAGDTAADFPLSGPIPYTRVSTRDSDFGRFSTGLRYGISQRAELSVRVSYAHVTWREPAGPAGNSELYALTLGGTWLASPENNTPALLLSVSIDALENDLSNSSNTVYGKTGRIGFTAYRSIDPVVLSLAAGYEYNAPREIAAGELEAGDQFYLVPQVNFAVNHKITLTGGVGLQIRQGDEIDGAKVSQRKNTTDVLLGLGFAASGRSTIFFQSRFATAGGRSAILSLDWLYTF